MESLAAQGIPKPPTATLSCPEFVIIGNDVLLKCSVPSFALDFILLNGWVTNEGVEILANSKDGKILLMRDGEMMAFNLSAANIFFFL